MVASVRIVALPAVELQMWLCHFLFTLLVSCCTVLWRVGRTNRTLWATNIVENKDRPHFPKEFFCHFIYTLYVFGVVASAARWCDCIFRRDIFPEISFERSAWKLLTSETHDNDGPPPAISQRMKFNMIFTRCVNFFFCCRQQAFNNWKHGFPECRRL